MSYPPGLILQPSDAESKADPGVDEGVLQLVPVRPAELPRGQEEVGEEHEEPEQGREGLGEEAAGQEGQRQHADLVADAEVHVRRQSCLEEEVRPEVLRLFRPKARLHHRLHALVAGDHHKGGRNTNIRSPAERLAHLL